MNFLNEDFDVGGSSPGTAADLRMQYLSTLNPRETKFRPTHSNQMYMDDGRELGKAGPMGTLVWNTLVLSERAALNYSRNLLAYGVRAGMYAGMCSELPSINKCSEPPGRDGFHACVR